LARGFADHCHDSAAFVTVIDHRAHYALGVLLNQNPLDTFRWPDWLTYGEKNQDHARPAVHIVRTAFFSDIYGKPVSQPALPLADIEGTPLLYGEPRVEHQGGGLVVHGDIIASAYYLLTRYEEWICPDVRDEHGRFPGRESLPFRAGFINRPLVDEYSELLRKWAALVGIELPEPNRRFSILLTHDVDSLGLRPGLRPAIRWMAAGLSGRRPLGSWPPSASA
jgi:hypothetical protein